MGIDSRAARIATGGVVAVALVVAITVAFAVGAFVGAVGTLAVTR